MEFFTFGDDYVRRLVEGDRWTEEHFISYFQRLLLIKLRARLRTLEQIDDVRQEVFARVFAALRTGEKLRDPRALGSYVNSVCNFVLLERYRQDQRTEPLDEERHDMASGDDLDEAFATTETKAMVRRVLERLPARDADLLRAVFIEEREKDDVCKTFGVDREYLRVLVHRAKEKFRAEYLSGRITQSRTM